MHVYADDASYTVTVRLADDDMSGDFIAGTVAAGDFVEQTFTVTVNNAAPTLSSVSGDVISEDEVATVSGEFSDPGVLDSFTVEITWGDGSVITYAYELGSTVFSEMHQYLDDGSGPGGGIGTFNYPVAVTVTDSNMYTSNELSTTVTVNNVAPEVDAGQDIKLQVGDIFTRPSGDFFDVGTLDEHTAYILWGDEDDLLDMDGNVIDVNMDNIPDAAESLDVQQEAGTFGWYTHSYAAVRDSYIATVYVRDDDGGVGTDTFRVQVQTRGTKTLPSASAESSTKSGSSSLSSLLTSSSDGTTSELDDSTSDDTVLTNETIAIASSLPEDEESDVSDEANTDDVGVAAGDETDSDSVFIDFEETLLDELLAV